MYLAVTKNMLLLHVLKSASYLTLSYYWSGRFLITLIIYLFVGGGQAQTHSLLPQEL